MAKQMSKFSHFIFILVVVGGIAATAIFNGIEYQQNAMSCL